MLIKTIFTAILIGITTGSAFSQGMRQQPSTIPWHTDGKAAFAEAAKTNKPILAVFR